MRLRLLLTGLVAAAALAPAAEADPLYFTRECGGTVDAACYHDFCGIIDCIRRDCVAYSGAFGEGNAGICIGKARPRDPGSL